MGLETKLDENVHLRLFTVDDVIALETCINNNKEHLHEWKSWFDLLSTKKLIHRFIETNKQHFDQLFDPNYSSATHPGFQCGFVTESGEIVGMFGYQGINLRNKVAALGYWVSKDYEGKGLVTKAGEHLINYGWSVLNLHRFEIQAWVNNRRSAAVARRLGFVHETILKEIEFRDGKFLDHNLFRLIPSDRK